MSRNSPKKKEAQELRTKIGKALELAVEYAGIDGDQHRLWVIDQMVRTLTGCPTLRLVGTDDHGRKYAYDALGESEEYKELVRSAKEGLDGPDSYDWDTGIAP